MDRHAPAELKAENAGTGAGVKNHRRFTSRSFKRELPACRFLSRKAPIRVFRVIPLACFLAVTLSGAELSKSGAELSNIPGTSAGKRSRYGLPAAFELGRDLASGFPND